MIIGNCSGCEHIIMEGEEVSYFTDGTPIHTECYKPEDGDLE